MIPQYSTYESLGRLVSQPHLSINASNTTKDKARMGKKKKRSRVGSEVWV